MDTIKTIIMVIDPEHADILIEILKQQCEQESLDNNAFEVVDGSLILDSDNPNHDEIINSIYHPHSIDEIIIKNGKKYITIKFSNIIFLIGYKTYTKIYLKENKVIIDSRHLIDIIKQFPINIFRLSKRGVLLNTDCIEDYHKGNGNGGFFDMSEGNIVVVASRRKEKFEDIIRLLKGRRQFDNLTI